MRTTKNTKKYHILPITPLLAKKKTEPNVKNTFALPASIVFYRFLSVSNNGNPYIVLRL